MYHFIFTFAKRSEAHGRITSHAGIVIQMKDQRQRWSGVAVRQSGRRRHGRGRAALAGVVAFGGALANGVKDAQASRALMAETETILKNTGNAAG